MVFTLCYVLFLVTLPDLKEAIIDRFHSGVFVPALWVVTLAGFCSHFPPRAGFFTWWTLWCLCKFSFFSLSQPQLLQSTVKFGLILHKRLTVSTTSCHNVLNVIKSCFHWQQSRAWTKPAGRFYCVTLVLLWFRTSEVFERCCKLSGLRCSSTRLIQLISSLFITPISLWRWHWTSCLQNTWSHRPCIPKHWM